MNVILCNEKRNEVNSLNIEVIKSVEGEHEVTELIGMFTNFFFNKMVIDITAIKDYGDYANLKKFFGVVDPSKVVVLLNENDVCKSKEFISDLITLGVYNFTSKIDEVNNLINNPKVFKDVADLQVAKSDESINDEIDNNNTKNDKEFTFEDFTLPGEYDGNKKIIGICNVTEHAGATTLAVQMIKQLNINYSAIGIEMNKQDFIFFNTPFIYSCTSKPEVLNRIRQHQDCDAVIVDLNNFDYKEFCTDVIYLIEPGIIKITKIIKKNGKIFEDLSGQKIVLNRTNMDDDNVREFEVETNSKIFTTVSNFRDSIDRVVSVDKLLSKLGYTKCYQEEKVVPKKHLFFGK